MGRREYMVILLCNGSLITVNGSHAGMIEYWLCVVGGRRPGSCGHVPTSHANYAFMSFGDSDDEKGL